MAGHPDFQATGVWQGDPLVEEDNLAVGVGSVTFGPFGITGFRCVMLGWIMSTGDSDATIEMDATGTLTLPDTIYGFSVQSGLQGWAVVPAYGEAIQQVEIASSTAGSTADIYVAGSNRDPLWCGDSPGAPLLDYTGGPIANGATATAALEPHWGRARLICDLVGGNYALLGTAETRLGTVVARWLDMAAVTGEQAIEVWLPPRINRLRITNNTGANQNPDRTVIGLPPMRS